MISTTARPAPAAPGVDRLTAIDALRGAIMVIMALDHVRDFVHAGAMSFSPEDLSQTTPALFLTRWITHVCAPGFVFLAGVGAFLRLERGGSKRSVSHFLWTRGLWLIVVELTVMRLAMNFTFSMQYPVLLLILWALGVSMIALAVLIYLPVRVLATLSIAVIAFHNLLDSLQPAQFGAFAPIWNLLHQQGVIPAGGMVFVVGYPVLPWIAVMAGGFCFGQVFRWDAERRRRILLWTGGALTILFVVVRAINLYGDPQPWSAQASPTFTVLSFLRATKYPPSLQFLLMTLGPLLLALAWLDKRRLPSDHPLVTIGRVPFFYYVMHFWLAHVLTIILMLVTYGRGAFPLFFSPVPSMGGSRDLFPAGFGWSLWTTYLVWIAVVLMLYPACRWFGGVKARSRGWWVGYV